MSVLNHSQELCCVGTGQTIFRNNTAKTKLLLLLIIIKKKKNPKTINGVAMFMVSLTHKLYANAEMSQLHSFLSLKIHKIGNIKPEFLECQQTVGNSRGRYTIYIERENKTTLQSFRDEISFYYIGSSYTGEERWSLCNCFQISWKLSEQLQKFSFILLF